MQSKMLKKPWESIDPNEVGMETTPLFTTPFSQENLTINNNSLMKYAYKKAGPNNQSSHLNLHDKELADLLEAVNLHCKKLTMLWGLVEDCEIKVNQAWLNVTRPLEHPQNINETHMHPRHFTACVYYIKADQNCGDLVLFPPAQTTEYALPPKLVGMGNEFNGTRYTVTPKEGMLISFPGWINHQVKDNFSNNDRISIAFNCDLSGSALDNPTL